MEENPIEFPIQLPTIKSGWSIVYIEGSQIIISKKDYISLKIHFVLANSADTDEMPHYECGITVCQSTHLGFV